MNAIEERNRWMKFCRTPLDWGGDYKHQPELPIIETRLHEIADEMEEEPFPENLTNTEAVLYERSKWAALFRDYLTVFSRHLFEQRMEQKYRIAIDILFEIASDMEDFDEANRTSV